MRWLAALWYAVAALIPTMYVFGASLRPSAPGPQQWVDWLMLFAPVICGAIAGFLFGVSRQPDQPPSGWRSALRGLGVALFAFLLVALLIGVLTAIEEKDWTYVVLMPPMTLLFGGARVGWLILLVAPVAGWLFDRVVKSDLEGGAA